MRIVRYGLHYIQQSPPAVLYGFNTRARSAPCRASRGTRDVTGTARSGRIAWPFPELYISEAL